MRQMLWKKGTLMGFTGFILGSLIGICFGLAGGEAGGLRATLPDIVLGGLYGAVAMSSAVVYDIEKWSIARATAVHFLLVVGLYCLLAFSMGWFMIEEPVFWIVIAAMVVGYILIWLFLYLAYRRKIQQMNEDLKTMKSLNHSDRSGA